MSMHRSRNGTWVGAQCTAPICFFQKNYASKQKGKKKNTKMRNHMFINEKFKGIIMLSGMACAAGQSRINNMFVFELAIRDRDETMKTGGGRGGTIGSATVL